MGRELILTLGGARSGKSALAERLAASGGRVLYVATAEALDDEMRTRIQVHRDRRPAAWETLEAPVDLAEAIRSAPGSYDTVLVDCLTLWVSNLILAHEERDDTEPWVLERARGLLEAYEASPSRWIVVSNEVGSGIVPTSALGRLYRDVLGRVNQLIAARADRVFLLVAGIALDLKAGGVPADDLAESIGW